MTFKRAAAVWFIMLGLFDQIFQFDPNARVFDLCLFNLNMGTDAINFFSFFTEHDNSNWTNDLYI